MGDLRTFNLDRYVRKYEVQNFVETGTFKGEATEYAAQFKFNEIHTIEIDPELATNAQNKFNNDTKITVHNGDSVTILKKILPKLDGNCLFWLDAHFPGADAHKERYDAIKDEKIRIPLVEELKIIVSRVGKYRDVIIIDDLWLYEDNKYEWGTLDGHLSKTFPGLGYTRELLSGGQDSSFIYSLFSKSHRVKKKMKHQGYLILTPKSNILGKVF